MPRLFVLVGGTDDPPRLASLLGDLRAVLEPRWPYQIVVVDDAHTSDSAALLAARRDQLPLEVIVHRFRRGRRESLRDGVEWIADRCNDDDIVVLIDPAGADDMAALPVMVAALDAGTDVVTASRRRAGAAGGGGGRGAALVETAGLLLLRRLFRLPGVRDYTAHLFAVRARVVRGALEHHRGALLSAAPTDATAPLELLCKLVRTGGVCTEVDVPGRATAPAPRLDVVDFLWSSGRLWWRLRERAAPPPPVPVSPLQRWEWLALAGIVAAALAIRLYAIERIPAVVIHDECDNLVNVYQIFHGRGPGVFGFDWKPQPAASVYLLSLFMRLGMSILTLRLPAVLYSLLALIPFYLLARRALAAPAALLATGLLATDIWYLHFSRTGWENVATCLFLAAAAVCVRDAVRGGRMRSFLFAGVWSALGAYGYFSGRAVLPAVVLVILLSLIRPRIPRPRLLAGLLLTVVTTIVLYAPQLPTIVRQWDLFQKRSRTVSILGGYNADRSIGQQAGILVRSFTRKSRQLFFGRPMIDRYLRLEKGPLAAPTAFLLAVGMALSLAMLRETWLWWIFLLVPFVLTQVLTTGDLNGARGIIFVPILYLFVALTIHSIWQACRAVHRAAPAIVVLAAVVLAGSTTREYFAWIQSPAMIDDLQPAVPVGEFEAWQAHVLKWTATTDDFFNVYMWKDHQARLQGNSPTRPSSLPAPNPVPQPTP